MLKHLVDEQDIFVGDAQRIVSMLNGVHWRHVKISKATHVLYTAMFREASEKVIDYSIDLVTDDCKLEFEPVWGLLLLMKYSSRLCKKLIKRLTLLECTEWNRI